MTDSWDDAEMGRAFVLATVEQAVRDGDLSIEEKDEAEIATAAVAYIRSLLDDGQAWSNEPTFQLDHEGTLASEAARHHAAGHPDISILLHATRVEHWLNQMIIWALDRRGFDDKFRRTVIREASLRAKIGWLWQLLFEQPLSDDLARRITNLAESRNAFVHYKWQGDDFARVERRREDNASLSATADQLLADLRALEDDIVFAGKRGVLAAALGLEPNSTAEEPLT
jgi:hypothetical protein